MKSRTLRQDSLAQGGKTTEGVSLFSERQFFSRRMRAVLMLFMLQFFYGPLDFALGTSHILIQKIP